MSLRGEHSFHPAQLLGYCFYPWAIISPFPLPWDSCLGQKHVWPPVMWFPDSMPSSFSKATAGERRGVVRRAAGREEGQLCGIWKQQTLWGLGAVCVHACTL